MATITEDYVSLEIARLLSRKKFNEECLMKYVDEELMNIYDSDFPSPYELDNYNSEVIDAPTLQMAMKWLREVHNIGIFPSTYTITNSKGSKEEHVYGSAIVNLITFDLMCDDIMPRNSYEEACEAAIKYCLENLI